MEPRAALPPCMHASTLPVTSVELPDHPARTQAPQLLVTASKRIVRRSNPCLCAVWTLSSTGWMVVEHLSVSVSETETETERCSTTIRPVLDNVQTAQRHGLNLRTGEVKQNWNEVAGGSSHARVPTGTQGGVEKHQPHRERVKNTVWAHAFFGTRS